MTDWQNEADVALERLRRNADSEIYQNLLQWLGAHLEHIKYELCLSQPNPQSVEWLQQRAVIFKALLDELDNE